MVELYALRGKGDGGWAVAADLGWRSRLFRIVRGLVMNRIQYKGIGVVEGEYTIRTPSGVRLIFYQDGGTLFIAEGEMAIRALLGREQKSGPGESISRISFPLSMEDDDIAYISFSNYDMEVTRVVEEMEKEVGFLLLPSIRGIKGGTVKLRHGSGETLVGEIFFNVKEEGNIGEIEGDISYLIEVLDRFLNSQNLEIEKTINSADGSVTAQIMIHPAGGPK